MEGILAHISVEFGVGASVVMRESVVPVVILLLGFCRGKQALSVF